MWVEYFGSDKTRQDKCSEIIPSYFNNLKTLIKYWKDICTCKKTQQEALLILQIYHSETFSLLAHRWRFLLWQSNLGWQCVLPSSATQRAVLSTWPKQESRPSKINVGCSLQASKIQSETKHNQPRRRHLPIVHQFRFTADTLHQEISSKDLVC